MTFVVLALLVAAGLFAYSLCAAAGRASREEERLLASRAELQAFLARHEERAGVLRPLRGTRS